MMAPQFGTPNPGLNYPDRPAAFAIVERDRRIALVRVAFENGGGRTDLPGGGLDPGEGAVEAVARECGEEAGLVVSVGDRITLADHFFVNENGQAHNTRGQFFAAEFVREDARLKIEDDHTLLWVEPTEAILILDRESHAWAVCVWLRRARTNERGRR